MSKVKTGHVELFGTSGSSPVSPLHKSVVHVSHDTRSTPPGMPLLQISASTELQLLVITPESPTVKKNNF